jgi:hypothetical protein
MDGNIEHMRKESNQSDKYDESGKPSESNKCTCDPGTNATCTCTGAAPVSRTPSTRSAEHTSFPCAHCGDHVGNTGLIRKHKYSVHPTIADHVERDYADYIATANASAQGQGASTGVRGSDESRNFKQADADSGDTVERRIGIPAGVTI